MAPMANRDRNVKSIWLLYSNIYNAILNLIQSQSFQMTDDCDLFLCVCMCVCVCVIHTYNGWFLYFLKTVSLITDDCIYIWIVCVWAIQNRTNWRSTLIRCLINYIFINFGKKNWFNYFLLLLFLLLTIDHIWLIVIV